MNEFDAAVTRIREENQGKLPEEDRIAKAEEHFCLAVNDGYKCTKYKDHNNQHITHSSLDYTIQK